MTSLAYWGALIVAALACSGAVAWAHEKPGRPYVIVTTLLAIGVLLFVGFLNWKYQTHRDTELKTYLLLATVPTIVTTVLIGSLSRRGRALGIQLIAGAVTWMVIGVGIVVMSYFFF